MHKLQRLRPLLAPLAFAGALFFYWRVSTEHTRPTTGAATPRLKSSTPRTVRSRAADRDVTFYAVSDLHFGFVPENVHAELANTLARFAGHPYPKTIGGNVAPPRALIITGDLTESGKEEEWKRFLYFYGSTASTPSAAGLEIPVFEVVGNHDDAPGPYVADQVAARHGGKPYAFDFDDVHFVALGEAPDDNALDWLENDLDGIAKDVPLVIYFHLALLGPWSTGNWFNDGDYKERLATILEGRCVVGIFHGHHHATDHYVWHGFDVYKPGAVKHDAHTFAVTHIVHETMSIAYYHYDQDRWVWSQTKNICP